MSVCVGSLVMRVHSVVLVPHNAKSATSDKLARDITRRSGELRASHIDTTGRRSSVGGPAEEATALAARIATIV